MTPPRASRAGMSRCSRGTQSSGVRFWNFTASQPARDRGVDQLLGELDVAVVVDADLGDDVRGLAVTDAATADVNRACSGHVVRDGATSRSARSRSSGSSISSGALGRHFEHRDVPEEAEAGPPESFGAHGVDSSGLDELHRTFLSPRPGACVMVDGDNAGGALAPEERVDFAPR